MPAYFVAIRTAMKDPDKVATYRRLGGAASIGHEMKRLVGYGRHRALIGDDPDGVAIVEFPSFEAAETWFESKAYQDALEHLFKGADYQMFIVEGRDPDAG